MLTRSLELMIHLGADLHSVHLDSLRRSAVIDACRLTDVGDLMHEGHPQPEPVEVDGHI